jgi:hypothetical protein
MSHVVAQKSRFVSLIGLDPCGLMRSPAGEDWYPESAAEMAVGVGPWPGELARAELVVRELDHGVYASQADSVATSDGEIPICDSGVRWHASANGFSPRSTFLKFPTTHLATRK